MIDPITSKQPYKALYSAFVVLKVFAAFPFISIYYIPSRLRPNKYWSWKASVVASGLRVFFHWLAQTRTQSPMQLEPGKAKERFVLVRPAEESAYPGIAAAGTIKPTALGALWFPRPIPPLTDMKSQKIVLHIPGGAFVTAMDPERYGPVLQDVMEKHLKISHVLVAAYRLATPQTRFPAALQDVVTHYTHLLGLGFDSRNIYISGDSAGGNLVLALIRLFESEAASGHSDAPALPLPGGAMVWSPWVHVTPDAGKVYEESPNAKEDILAPSLLQWGAGAYIPDGEFGRRADPYISCLHHPFFTKTPLFIQAGTAEAFFDSINTFAGEMAGIMGNKIHLHSSNQAPHDLVQASEGLDMHEHLVEAVRDAYDFFEMENNTK